MENYLIPYFLCDEVYLPHTVGTLNYFFIFLVILDFNSMSSRPRNFIQEKKLFTSLNILFCLPQFPASTVQGVGEIKKI